MSGKTVVIQCCAICEREKKTSNGITTSYTTNRFSTSSYERSTFGLGFSLRHKYGHLPARKHDDFLIQVTEPQWLRRGNLKKSDFVCKRHLAILMRGVDRGCEGGCCSPLHRGARIGKPGGLKTIPPTWRRRFMKHPKIKDEDKELMLLCWDCYKKHINRMSKYGDPMGRSFGNKNELLRSNSLVDSEESKSSFLQAMKKYKSMDRLDSGHLSPVSTSPTGEPPRRRSTSSLSPHYSGDGSPPGKPNDPETTISSPTRRTNRGRRSNRGKRSPSPPNNISPVRTSIVHSKRKHSPHKVQKRPGSGRSDNRYSSGREVVKKTSQVTFLEMKSSHSAPRLSVDEGALADTESLRSTVPSVTEFSSADPSDVFEPRNNITKDQQPVDELQSISVQTNTNAEQSAEFRVSSELENPPNEEHQQRTYAPGYLQEVPTICDGLQQNEIDNNNNNTNLVEGVAIPEAISPINQFEESTTSADEMAEIFANHINIEDDDSFVSPEYGITQEKRMNVSEVMNSSVQYFWDHERGSSGSGSDNTGDTQIERVQSLSNLASQKPNTQRNGKPCFVNESEKTENGFTTFTDNFFGEDSQISPRAVVDELHMDQSQTKDLTAENVSNPLKKAVFVAASSYKENDAVSNAENTVLSFGLSAQPSRRLEPLMIEFSEVPTESGEVQKSDVYFSDDVRERTHPLRSHVLMKVPRDLRIPKHSSSFIRVPAEDVEIYPDTISYLNGITQTVGEEIAMYAKDGLYIAGVNLKKKENRAAHRTSEFSSDLLILRRGQAFEVELELNEDYVENKHTIVVELLQGDSPRVSNSTHLFLPVQTTSSSSVTYEARQDVRWSARITETQGKLVRFSLTSPPTCPIGTYSLCFQIEKDGIRSRWQSGSEDDRSLIVLFNPWCIDDAVFMSSQADKTEYVTSDCGCIYAGNEINLIPIPTMFGQYESEVLQACVELLESSDLHCMKRGDPVMVSRTVCQLLSEISDKNQVMSGGFSKCFSSLNGPVGILQNYYHTGSLHLTHDNINVTAVLVTVFRCLGLPSRPVTCMGCAVETDLPMTVNLHYTEDGHSLDYMNTDRMWPVYCWAGVWMSRVDLPPGFGGWQAILPPPQSVGPIPVYGIKKGQTAFCEGTQGHFMALNASRKHWVVSQDGSMNLVNIDKDVTCKLVVTKSVGNMESQNITKIYKFSGDCEEQRLASHTAFMHCGGENSFQTVEDSSKDIQMTLSTNPPVISFGGDVDVITKIINTSDNVRHLTVNLTGAVLSQDGTTIGRLQKETILAEVLPNQSVEIPVKVKLGPCLHKLSPSRQLAFTAFGIVRETRETYVIATHLAGIKYQDIEIQLHGEFKVGGEMTVLAKLRNPLPHMLHNARIIVSSSGLVPLEVKSKTGKSVGPWQVFKTEKVYRCQRSGKHKIIAAFESDHLKGPMGIQEIEIT